MPGDHRAPQQRVAPRCIARKRAFLDHALALGADRIANISSPETQGQPVWIARHEQSASA